MKPFLGCLLFFTTIAFASDSKPIPDAVLFSSYRITVVKGDKALDIGSSVAIDKRHIITASHVVTKDDADVRIDIFDHEGIYKRSIPCKIVRKDDDADLALLEADEELPARQTLDYGSAKVGDVVYAVGAAWGDAPFSVATGNLVSKANAEFESLWQMSATIVPGMSGGGVYSADHKFLGIMVRGAKCAGGLFVPAECVKEFLANHRDTEAQRKDKE